MEFPSDFSASKKRTRVDTGLSSLPPFLQMPHGSTLPTPYYYFNTPPVQYVDKETSATPASTTTTNMEAMVAKRWKMDHTLQESHTRPSVDTKPISKLHALLFGEPTDDKKAKRLPPIRDIRQQLVRNQREMLHSPISMRFPPFQQARDNRSDKEEVTTNIPKVPSIAPLSFGFAINFKEKYGNLFTLLQQPHSKQRKSYLHTIRYIQPNPLELIQRSPRPCEFLPRILGGKVEVELVTESGEPTPPYIHNLLRSNPNYSEDEEVFTKDLVNGRAKFALMFMDTSGGIKYRLKFRIRYEADDLGTKYVVDEELLSDPFHVDCNQKTPKLHLPFEQ